MLFFSVFVSVESNPCFTQSIHTLAKMVPRYGTYCNCCNWQVSKWRLQFKEAEARLAELTGGQPGDVKNLVWGVGDEERFRGELDDKVGVLYYSIR